MQLLRRPGPPTPPAVLGAARSMPATFTLALLASCAWLLLCVVFLLVLVPTQSGFVLALKMGVTIVPLLLLWGLYAAGAGGEKSIAALLVVILVITELSLRRRAFEDTSADPQNLVKMAVWGVGLLVALINWGTLRQALREPATALLALTTLWFAATAVYSPIPVYTLGAAIALLAVVLFGAVARRSVRESILLKAPAAALTVMLLVGLALYVVAPDRALAQTEGGTVLRLAAPFATPNQLGRAAALVVLLTVIGMARGHVRWRSFLVWLGIPAALACLVLSQSRTAGGALLAALLLVYGSKRPRRALAMAIVLAALGIVYSMLDIDLADLAALVSRTGHVSELTTLTGRTAIWAAVWQQILEQPLLGYGHAAGKVLIPQIYRTFWGWTATHAHNMWLQTWFTTGLVGVLLLLATLLAQLRYCLRTRDLGSLALLAFVFVAGMAEAGNLSGAPSVLTVMWALWLTGPAPAPAKAQAPGARAAPGRSARGLGLQA
ncbi:MAG: O-antigen ligase family protein [Burkholderiales bacterium]|nr:O-antigen ligase family protein [Burkholderiales bacterium]